MTPDELLERLRSRKWIGQVSFFGTKIKIAQWRPDTKEWSDVTDVSEPARQLYEKGLVASGELEGPDTFWLAFQDIDGSMVSPMNFLRV